MKVPKITSCIKGSPLTKSQRDVCIVLTWVKRSLCKRKCYGVVEIVVARKLYFFLQTDSLSFSRFQKRLCKRLWDQHDIGILFRFSAFWQNWPPQIARPEWKRKNRDQLWGGILYSRYKERSRGVWTGHPGIQTHDLGWEGTENKSGSLGNHMFTHLQEDCGSDLCLLKSAPFYLFNLLLKRCLGLNISFWHPPENFYTWRKIQQSAKQHNNRRAEEVSEVYMFRAVIIWIQKRFFDHIRFDFL